MNNRERGECLWAVCDEAELRSRIQLSLSGKDCSVRFIGRSEALQTGFWRDLKVLPGAVLLDLDEDLDWAVEVLREIKQAHIRSPVIVVSKDSDREFGMKIVSAGISYFLLRDFDSRELCEVVMSLVKPAQHHAPRS